MTDRSPQTQNADVLPKARTAKRRTVLRFGIESTLGMMFPWPIATAMTQDDADEAWAVKRDGMLKALADIIAISVARRDTRHPVFHGCYDWHSCVHGHWAILRIARVTGQHGELAGKTAEALQSENLHLEAETLRKDPQFEMPYGRAWFLRLAIDYELWAEHHQKKAVDQLRLMSDEVAESLMQYYRRLIPSPTSREYLNDAWAIVQMRNFFQHRQQKESLIQVDKLISSHFVQSDARLRFRQDRESAEFFSRFGNWAYLIAKTQDRPTVDTFLQQQMIDEEELRPVDPLLRPPHHLGVNWSRAWALRALAGSSSDAVLRKRFENAYQQHVGTAWRHHQQYSGNYAEYDHWVPQFAVYALTE